MMFKMCDMNKNNKNIDLSRQNKQGQHDVLLQKVMRYIKEQALLIEKKYATLIYNHYFKQ